jgi:hypothetical protein
MDTPVGGNQDIKARINTLVNKDQKVALRDMAVAALKAGIDVPNGPQQRDAIQAVEGKMRGVQDQQMLHTLNAQRSELYVAYGKSVLQSATNRALPETVTKHVAVYRELENRIDKLGEQLVKAAELDMQLAAQLGFEKQDEPSPLMVRGMWIAAIFISVVLAALLVKLLIPGLNS